MLGKRARTPLVVLVTVIGLVAAAPATATFPGSNGRIPFSKADLIPPIGGESGDLSAHSQVFTIGAGGAA